MGSSTHHYLFNTLEYISIISTGFWKKITNNLSINTSCSAGLGILSLLKSNERLWVICSDCSGQMSYCKRIPQIIAHVKRATVSKSLRSLMSNERPWAIRSGCSEENERCEGIAHFAHQKWAKEWIAHFLSESLICSFFDKKRAIRWEIKWANSQPC